MGIGYKPTQSDGNVCGGPCPYDADDYYNYYWLWDVNDLLAVKNGTLNPHDVRPYDYGVFNAPFGASTGAYDRVPAIAAYSISIDSSCPTAGTPCNDDNPNTENDLEDGLCNCSGTPISSSNCELLLNPNFDNDLTGWLNWGCAAESIGGIVNLTNITPNTTNIWEVRMRIAHCIYWFNWTDHHTRLITKPLSISLQVCKITA